MRKTVSEAEYNQFRSRLNPAWIETDHFDDPVVGPAMRISDRESGKEICGWDKSLSSKTYTYFVNPDW